jgi:hypothetical protein
MYRSRGGKEVFTLINVHMHVDDGIIVSTDNNDRK